MPEEYGEVIICHIAQQDTACPKGRNKRLRFASSHAGVPTQEASRPPAVALRCLRALRCMLLLAMLKSHYPMPPAKGTSPTCLRSASASLMGSGTTVRTDRALQRE